jgi:hypothetical protein
MTNTSPTINLLFRKHLSPSPLPLPPREREIKEHRIQVFEAGNVLTTFYSLPSAFLFNVSSVADI